jgi:hypothetical protein
MKGKFPVRSLYTTPDILSANVPKRNIFAIDSSSGMMLTCLRAPRPGPWYCGGSTKIGKMIGATCLIVVGIFITLSAFFVSVFCSNPLLWALHVALCCCRTQVQVFYHKFLIEIGAPFEEPSSYSFREGWYCRIAQRLVCKFYGVGSSAQGVCECYHLCQNGCDLVVHGGLQGMSHTGAGLWLSWFCCMGDIIGSWGGL